MSILNKKPTANKTDKWIMINWKFCASLMKDGKLIYKLGESHDTIQAGINIKLLRTVIYGVVDGRKEIIVVYPVQGLKERMEYVYENFSDGEK